MKRGITLAALFAVCICGPAAPYAREFVMPRLVPATAMAAHDIHAQEKLAFAADSYDSEGRASIFHAGLLQHGVMPVLVVFTNDGEERINLANARFELVTRDRAKAEPYSMDDLRRALTAIRAPGTRAQDQIPIPAPGKGSVHGGLSNRDRDELQRAMFSAVAVDAHASRQGFLFFDVSGLDDPARGARLYVTGVTDNRGHELMYFEVLLGPAEPDQPKQSDSEAAP